MDSFTCDESFSDVIGLSEYQIKHIIGFGKIFYFLLKFNDVAELQ